MSKPSEQIATSKTEVPTPKTSSPCAKFGHSHSALTTTCMRCRGHQTAQSFLDDSKSPQRGDEIMTLDGHLAFAENTVHFYKPNVT